MTDHTAKLRYCVGFDSKVLRAFFDLQNLSMSIMHGCCRRKLTPCPGQPYRRPAAYQLARSPSFQATLLQGLPLASLFHRPPTFLSPIRTDPPSRLHPKERGNAVLIHKHVGFRPAFSHWKRRHVLRVIKLFCARLCGILALSLFLQ